MSRPGRCAVALFSLLASAGASTAIFASPGDADDLLVRADAPREAFAEGIIHLRAVVNDRGKTPQSSELTLLVKGTDRSLVIFRDGKQKGRKILTQGDRVFLIVPGASRPIPVSKTQRLMGAASYGDIARLRLADEYDATIRPGEGGADRILELTAKRSASAYPKAVLWIGREDGLAHRLRLALASGKDAKDVSFLRYDAERRIAAMEIRDLLAAGGGSVTELQFEKYEKRPIDPAIFEPEGARAAP